MSVDLTPEERAQIVAERADVKYGPFASLHEAYGVLAEEWYEVCECKADTWHGVMSVPLSALHANDGPRFVFHAHTIKKLCRDWCDETKREDVARELIDVIAVCDRIIAQWGENPE